MYYNITRGSERDTLQIGGSSFDGASTSFPSLNKPTDVITVNDITSMYQAFFNKSYIATFSDKDGYLSNCTTMRSAFYGCTSLTSVELSTLPECTSMEGTFYNCTSLTSIELPALPVCTTMEYTFENCASLTSIELPALPKCTNMKEVFKNCTSLTSAKLSAVPECTTMYYAFYGCTSLTSIELPALPVCTTMYYAFYGCTSLTSIELPVLPNCTDMEYAFSNCTSLTSIDLPALPNCIYMSHAFTNCDGLNRITLPDLPSLIGGSYMLAECNSLNSVEHGIIGNGYTSLNYMFENCMLLTSFDFKDVYANSIASMFEGCTLLTSVVNLSSTFITNALSAFYKCTVLSNIELYLPNLSDSSSMFYECANLRTVTGSMIGTKCESQFMSCGNLTTINTAGRSSYTRNTNMFSGCLKLVGSSGYSYDPNNCGSDQAKVGDGGLLSYTLGKDLYNISYSGVVTLTLRPSDSSSYYGKGRFYNINNCKGRAADGETLTLKGLSSLTEISAWVIVDSKGYSNVKLGSEVTIPITDNITIYPISKFAVGSGDISYVVKSIVNP